MTMAHIPRQILDELRDVLDQTDPRQGELFVQLLLAAKRIFVCGQGRSGLMMKAFAMRLMHLGFTAFVVGETTVPSIQGGDLLVVGSSSGETATSVCIAGLAKKAGATVIALTGHPDSTLARLAHAVVVLPVRNIDATHSHTRSNSQPLGSLAEQSLLIYLDAIVVRLMTETAQTAEAMRARHANLE
jgi:6-phospho-3-hexuloisomerase